MGNRSARAITWLATAFAAGLLMSACAPSTGGVHARFYLHMSQAGKALNKDKLPAKAEKLYLQAVDEVEKAPTGKNDLSELQKNVMLTEGWEALANCYSVEGKNELAAQTFKKRIDLAQKQAGPGHPLPASLLSRYEELLRKAGKTAEADAVKEEIKKLPAEPDDNNAATPDQTEKAPSAAPGAAGNSAGGAVGTSSGSAGTATGAAGTSK